MSFLPFGFRSFARHGSRSSHLSRACDGATANSADVCRGDQAVARVAHVSALQMQRKGLIFGKPHVRKNIKKRKRAQA